MRADLYIKNGKTVDGEKIEIIIHNKKIVEYGEALKTEARNVLDLQEKYFISPGWIDSHVHANEKMNLYYDNPDTIGVEQGVSTIIDAGSTGAHNIDEFYESLFETKTNVYALINISESGIVHQNELSDLNKISKNKVLKAIQQYPDFILGLKARMSQSVIGDNGIKPLELGKVIQKETHQLPLMVHIGSAPPQLGKIMELMEKGDIITHCFNGKDNSIMTKQNRVHEYIKDAQKKGIFFDLGHGSASFNFSVAELAFNDNFQCDTVSTDIYHRNRVNGPVYDMSTTIEKMLSVGYSLEKTIKKITEIPAKMYSLENKGFIQRGLDADLTIFKVLDKDKELIDSSGHTRITKLQIIPKYTIVAGEIFRAGDKYEKDQPS